MQNAQYFSDFNRIWCFSTDFHSCPNIKFHGHQPSRSEADACRERDRYDAANRRFFVSM